MPAGWFGELVVPIGEPARGFTVLPFPEAGEGCLIREEEGRLGPRNEGETRFDGDCA